MKIFILIQCLSFVTCSFFGQDVDHCNRFQELATIELDCANTPDSWVISRTEYPSGRVQEENRIYVSTECNIGANCEIRYQHQVYSDDSSKTILLKEGMYYNYSKSKVKFKHYAWWYDNSGKMFRRLREKRIFNL